MAEGIGKMLTKIEKNEALKTYRVVLVFKASNFDRAFFVDPNVIKKLDAQILDIENRGYTWVGDQY